MTKILAKIMAAAPMPVRLARLVKSELAAQRSKPVRLDLGFTLRGNAHQASGQFEADELAFVRRELEACDALIDVGANVGLYACLACKNGKPTIAVEPLPDNLRYLYANLLDNGFDEVAVHPVALGERPGLLTLYGTGTGASLIAGWAGARRQTTVPVATLDSIVRGAGLPGQQILIKVDVEGAELSVLGGAEETLSATPAPTWLVEIVLHEHHPSGQNPDFKAAFDVFWRHGYKATTVKDQRDVTPTDVAEWVRTGRRSFGDYNYIFRRS